MAATGALFVALLLHFLQPQAAAEQRFGLWVEAEGKNQPFRSREDFNTFLDFANEGGFTDLYCQIYRGGRAWYSTSLADDAPYQQAKSDGFDPLRDTIAFAHARGGRVHAWVNVLRISNDDQLPLLRALGKEVVLRDNYGNSLLEYDGDGNAPGQLGLNYKLGTPGVWLDPSFGKLREYLVEVIKDILLEYPEIDGIHLDMIRYPEAIYRTAAGAANSRPDYGYSQNSIAKFYELAGREPPLISQGLINALRSGRSWDAWRRAQITLLVFEIKEMMNRVAPKAELSAAVIASPDRAYSEVFQDWASWLRGGILDAVLLMSYSESVPLVAEQSRYAVAKSAPGKVITGLGAWLMLDNPALLAQEAKAANKTGVSGVTLFSYSNLLSSQGRTLVQQFCTLAGCPQSRALAVSPLRADAP